MIHAGHLDTYNSGNDIDCDCDCCCPNYQLSEPVRLASYIMWSIMALTCIVSFIIAIASAVFHWGSNFTIGFAVSTGASAILGTVIGCSLKCCDRREYRLL